MANANLGFQVFGIRFYAEDLDAAAKFYTEVLGCKVLMRFPVPGGEELVIAPPAGEGTPSGPQFVFIDKKPPAEEIPRTILKTDDIDALTEAFISAGGKMGPPVHGEMGIRVVFLSDPFGNGIELIQMPSA